ncbi:hypothetical protein GKZ90_0012525 [Flavobacterium sp. MC2016-06]|uniref:hypothetical protein n=1 Tax=Flavobacterium sp. MC2016-06 TaxID=2676308 RepID=UPI0012BA927B|nr:hypothetical protein [Flavobacterium sp. MC2016-06]MBU3860135.1 fibronectin type III domain-containing protein [Flavobacterium sp. MC2016-06]
MRKILKKVLLSLFAISLFSVLITINISCSSNEKDEDKAVIEFEGTEIINVTESSATINANLKSSGTESSILVRGICIAMQTNPTIDDIKYEEQGSVLGQYTAKFDNLQYNSKYYVRPYIKTDSKTIYGNELTFTTKTISLPTLTTKDVSDITQNSAIFSGKIENDGSSKILSKGFLYSKTNTNPEVKDQKLESTGDFEFSTSVAGLEPNVTYYVRAFASNLAGTAYAQVVTFKTSSFVLPTVSTSAPTSILETSAIAGGTVLKEGSSPVTQRGVCYDDFFPEPTIELFSKYTKDGVGPGLFTSSLTNLKPFKGYYVRAYAISAAGVAYGETIWVKTIGGDKPTVTASGGVNGLRAYATVTVTKQGSDNITAINVKCFDMEGNSVGKVASSSGWSNQDASPSVNYEITGLSRNNKYYVIGYATNGVGTGASERVYFTTL